MKSKRRHELQHNVLDAELGKIIGFLKRRGGQILWAIIAAGAIIALVVLINNWTAKKGLQRQREFTRLRSDPTLTAEARVEGLTRLASASDDRVAAMAWIQLGNQYVGRITLGRGNIPQGELTDLADQAEQAYRRVLAEFADRPMQVAQAHLGLGRLAEARGDAQAARQGYQAVLAMIDMAGHPVGLQAREGLAILQASPGKVPMATSMPARAQTDLPAILLPTTQPVSAPALGATQAAETMPAEP